MHEARNGKLIFGSACAAISSILEISVRTFLVELIVVR